ncbi:MAG: prepilin-type N-terminal cleavage/methylation domain-containing protein [Candidatus Omnitrophica bacterium]|nr:prepilin-type N-terminal cleavage/methylation domain-containing protein [Candidatus Omnitrophota bacterium]
MRRVQGFTLIEIMIVVAILAILVSMAIPSMLRSRLTTHDTAAQVALKSVASSQLSYRAANARYGTLPELGSSIPPYVDDALGCAAEPCTKEGYDFSTTENTAQLFCVTAVPNVPNVSGVRSFCVTEDGIVRLGGASGTTHDQCQALGPTTPS